MSRKWLYILIITVIATDSFCIAILFTTPLFEKRIDGQPASELVADLESPDQKKSKAAQSVFLAQLHDSDHLKRADAASVLSESSSVDSVAIQALIGSLADASEIVRASARCSLRRVVANKGWLRTVRSDLLSSISEAIAELPDDNSSRDLQELLRLLAALHPEFVCELSDQLQCTRKSSDQIRLIRVAGVLGREALPLLSELNCYAESANDDVSATAQAAMTSIVVDSKGFDEIRQRPK